jgi:hypothetical protein
LKKPDPVLSEDRARRLWERAAQLQAEAAQKEETAEIGPDDGEPGGKLLEGDDDEATGYSLTHIKQAGKEVGIEPDFLDLAFAEEAILELEGGAGSGFWDRTSERFLQDTNQAFELYRRFGLPPQRVWLALEKALTSEANELELLEVRGGDPAGGGIAIFESPYSYQRGGSLQYWATVAESRRYMIQITPDEAEGCEVSVRAPLRRSRRVNGAVGIVLSGVGGFFGGGLGLGIASLFTGGLAAPALLAFTAGGVVGGQALTRLGYRKLYRSAFRSLGKAFERMFARIERDVQRDLEKELPPETGRSSGG